MLKKQNITEIVCNGFLVVLQLFQVQSTINTLLAQKMIDLTTFVIGMSPAITITTSSFTLFEVQKHIEDNNNEEVYPIRHLSRKLLKRYRAEGSKVRLTQRAGVSKLCFCKMRPIA